MLLKTFLVVLLFHFSLSDQVARGFLNPFSNLSRVIGGDRIDIEDAPYYVSISKPPAYRHYCGGSIISTQWILSAAHCYYNDPNPKSWKIRTGSTRVSRGGKLWDVEKLVLHPDYKSPALLDGNKDFALFKVKGTIKMDARTQIIKLADSTTVTKAGDEVLAVGHGQTNAVLHSTELFRGTVLKVLDWATCGDGYKENYPTYFPNGIFKDAVCVSAETMQGICFGDSGGGIESLKEGKLLGVSALMATDKCVEEGKPGAIFGSIADNREWIKKVANV